MRSVSKLKAKQSKKLLKGRGLKKTNEGFTS